MAAVAAWPPGQMAEGRELVETAAAAGAAVEAAARQARARYESSLEVLRKTLLSFPVLKEQLVVQETRLDTLEDRVSRLRVDIADFAAQAADRHKLATQAAHDAKTAAANSAGRARSSSGGQTADAAPVASGVGAPRSKGVSFVSEVDAENAEVREFHVTEFDAHVPEHGHWLPNAVRTRRNSFEQATDFAKALSGRMVKYSLGGSSADDMEECVLVEPMGKILSPHEYVSTGVVVCCLGAENPEELQEEWLQVLKQTRWLDAGLSVAIPDLQPGFGQEQEHLQAAITTVLKLVGVKRCILVGKGYGAEVAMDFIAAAGPARYSVAGLVLVAPGQLMEAAEGRLDMPTMLLWAQDDEEESFREARSWCEAMMRWRAPTCFKEVASGGHSIAGMFQSGEQLPQAMLHFASTTLLLAELRSLASYMDEGEDEIGGLPDSLVRLCDELPAYLAGMLGANPGSDEEGGCLAATLAKQVADGSSKKLRVSISRLQEWIRCGMQQVASATE
eukprot:TRINITY_DN111196_c0_g1_i1.p1 TRINITY_DN111196_c0_g1~~TRINITY_DN111196_c0_g1_i1.p1  ORF type:complete len:505 (-),score=138.50 TRINITY_DN111196_c0_g1_i1:46-1560(-)